MQETLDYINKRMQSIRKYDLQIEVIYSSLKAMKENSELTIEQALEVGCEEWDV